jgi:curved DNA-binding protein CbpA
VERIQDRPQEKQALTHYDDLGLPAGASDEEIREAYLNLVRLLHPDSQRDAALKRFAEAQMKRVSRAHAVLSDPERRLRYDRTLGNNGAEQTPVPTEAKRTVGRWRARALITIGWLICAFAGVVGIGWYFSQPASAPVQPAQASAPPVSPVVTQVAPTSIPDAPPADSTDTSPDLEALRSELAAAKLARDRALDQTVRQAKELDFLTGRLLNATHEPSFGPGRFSGIWLLSPSRPAPSASAYTPQSVDLIMAEHQGAIEGRYRARYPGMGVPEPPMVRFYFQGTCQNEIANAAFTGDGGSKGEIQLKLTSDNTLQLVWSLTDPGSQTGPSSGTLALVRKQ